MKTENERIDSSNKVIDENNKEIKCQNNKLETWNRKKQEIDVLWHWILERWHSETLDVTYLSKANDIFGRRTSAISTTID